MRVREIDFLRCIAVLLVLFFHYKSWSYLNAIGYIGVDLFFVLSGYLISGLLFKELNSWGDVNAKRFLIRRGFKIYPLFYLLIFVTVLVCYFTEETISVFNFLAEVTFTRNYLGGFWVHTWSICVEEHFYFIIALTLPFVGKARLMHVRNMNYFFVSVFIAGILLELANVFLQHRFGENFLLNSWARRVQTQYCFDSLLYGVFIAYNYMYNKSTVMALFEKYGVVLLIFSLVIIGVLPLYKADYFMPFRDTLFAIAFGNILLAILTNMLSFDKIKNSFVKSLFTGVSKMGVYSYAIYLFHIP